MAINLLDLVKTQLTDGVVGKAASFLGENQSVTQSGISAMLPAILGGIVNKGSTIGGAQSILEMVTSGNHDGSIFDNLGSIFGGGSSTDGLMKTGSSLLYSGRLAQNDVNVPFLKSSIVL